MTNITELKKWQCTGCGLCSNVCPKGIIHMEEDSEGFLYPMILNKNECIQCGKCLKLCPVIGRRQNKIIPVNSAVYAYDSDTDRLKKSASGAVASGLYRFFIGKEHGFVAGVRYTEDYKNVEYGITNKIEETLGFLGSKYVKANISNIIPVLFSILQNKKKVLFIGLPCEVAAIRTYFENCENLYLVELICHGPTSHIVLSKYIHDMEKKQNSQLKFFTMRGKLPYWKPYYIVAKFENGIEYTDKFLDSDFSMAFEVFKRPSCNECCFKDKRSCADLVIGDFHAAEKSFKEYNQYGVSIMFPVTEKGNRLVAALKSEGYIIGNTTEERAMGNTALLRPIKKYYTRNLFIQLTLKSSLKMACKNPIIRGERILLRIFSKIKNIIKYRLPRMNQEGWMKKAP